MIVVSIACWPFGHVHMFFLKQEILQDLYESHFMCIAQASEWATYTNHHIMPFFVAVDIAVSIFLQPNQQHMIMNAYY